MHKTILITGSTDGIGLLAANKLYHLGHTVLLHGRNGQKLQQVATKLKAENGSGNVQSYQADLASTSEVEKLAQLILKDHKTIDVLINNAGILKTADPITEYGIDVRLFVNTLAPYILTQRLLEIIPLDGRIINLASAAQAPLQLESLQADIGLDEMSAYSQSKLGIIMWSQALAKKLSAGPAVIAVNPGSLLASKMVKEGFGVAGKDINIGADILVELAISSQHRDCSGQYFDNDIGAYAAPHRAAQDTQQETKLLEMMATTWSRISG